MAFIFGTVEFKVYTEDGSLPVPTADDRGWLWYNATIQVATADKMFDLQAYLTTITAKPAMGIRGGGTVVVEAGAGERDITYPSSLNDEIDGSAILTAMTPVANLFYDDQWRIDVTWLITSQDI